MSESDAHSYHKTAKARGFSCPRDPAACGHSSTQQPRCCRNTNPNTSRNDQPRGSNTVRRQLPKRQTMTPTLCQLTSAPRAANARHAGRCNAGDWQNHDTVSVTASGLGAQLQLKSPTSVRNKRAGSRTGSGEPVKFGNSHLSCDDQSSAVMKCSSPLQ